MSTIKGSFLLTILLMMTLTSSSFAGPPFFTDDPEPVDFMHWEFYVASVIQAEKYDVNATLPHFEVNYGLVKDVQVHLLAPLGYVKSDAGKQYGYMDTELGVKYRFYENEESGLQIGVFPLAEIPTGNKDKQLGNGNAQFYFPLWVQKSWGSFTTYGGAGYWYNPGQDNVNWVFTGWELQYDFSKTFTLGGEIYYHTKNTLDGQSDSGFNIGGFINLSEQSHILFSIGHAILNENTLTGYLGFQLTI